MTEGDKAEIAYLTLEDFYRAAAEALGTDLATVRAVTNDSLAGSALAAPSAGFGNFEKYPEFAMKTAVLLQAVASNHALPDGNKRTALLCAFLFAALNGYRWVPPEGDDPDGTETAEMVEATSRRTVPLEDLASWIEDRLQAI